MVRLAWTIVGAAIIAMAASGAHALPVHMDPSSRHIKSRREDGESETYRKWRKAYDKRNRHHAMKRSHELRIPPSLEAFLKKRDQEEDNANHGLIKSSEPKTEDPAGVPTPTRSFFGANDASAGDGGVLGGISTEKVNQMLAEYDRILKEAGSTPGTQKDAVDPKAATQSDDQNGSAQNEPKTAVRKREQKEDPASVPTPPRTFFSVKDDIGRGGGVLGGISTEQVNQMLAEYDRILKEHGITPATQKDAVDPKTATQSDDQNGNAQNEPKTAVRKQLVDFPFREPIRRSEPQAEEPVKATSTSSASASSPTWSFMGSIKGWANMIQPMRASTEWAEKTLAAYNKTLEAARTSPGGQKVAVEHNTGPQSKDQGGIAQNEPAATQSKDQGAIAPPAQARQHQPVSADSPPVPKRRSAGPDPLSLSTDADDVRFAGNRAYLVYRARNVEDFVQGAGNRSPDNSGTQKFRKLVVPPTLKKVKLTYYWLMFQKKGADEGTTELRSCDGKTVFGTASNKFAQEIRMEGTGFLLNGKMLNLGDCDCGDGTNTFNCFDDISKDKAAPFGYGVKNIPLKPFVSVANNDKDRAVGTVLYAPDFDGFKLPNGKVHNGCLQKVDNIGRGGVASHIDFFALHKNIAMNYIVKKLNKAYIDVQWDAPRCRGNLLDYGMDVHMDFSKI